MAEIVLTLRYRSEPRLESENFIEFINKIYHPSSGRAEQALFNTTDTIIQPQSQQSSMIAMAMVVYSLASAISSNRLGDWLKRFITSKDVIFRVSDPVPFFHLWIVLLQFWQMSRQNSISLQQASTRDIEWDGEEMGG